MALKVTALVRNGIALRKATGWANREGYGGFVLVPKAGLYKGGLLKSLIGAAIPLLHTVASPSPRCISLSLSVSIQPVLCTRLTLY